MTDQPHRLEEILELLRKEYRNIEPPSSIEATLRAAIPSPRRVVSSRRWIWALAFAPVLVALSVWVAVKLPRLHRQGSIETLTPPAPERMEELKSATDFIILPSAETLPPPRELRIWRVRIAKGELAQFGFNVPPTVAADPIYADFAVGEDGFPREIRFVR